MCFFSIWRSHRTGEDGAFRGVNAESRYWKRIENARADKPTKLFNINHYRNFTQSYYFHLSVYEFFFMLVHVSFILFKCNDFYYMQNQSCRRRNFSRPRVSDVTLHTYPKMVANGPKNRRFSRRNSSHDFRRLINAETAKIIALVMMIGFISYHGFLHFYYGEWEIIGWIDSIRHIHAVFFISVIALWERTKSMTEFDMLT